MKIISKLLKIFLYLAILFLVVFCVFAVVLVMEWPRWVGIFVLFGIISMIAGVVLFRLFWRRRRERRFVSQMVEQDENFIKSMPSPEQQSRKELQSRWMEEVNKLRSSHLKSQGNPLYVLPWYMIIGESGSGKTTAITSSKLSSTFSEFRKTTGISGTKNCDWWFFDQAIVIDTAGKYTIPVDEGADRDEWQKFLQLLVKFRKREPLNGLVVTIAADKLINSDHDEIEDDGKTIRRRIQELMKGLGAKFPIYILVTKCDLIEGMTQFCESLPDKCLEQAMGGINPDPEKPTDIKTFVSDTFESVGEKIRDLRLLFFHNGIGPKGADPTLLLFPLEIERIQGKLEAFMTTLFADTKFEESPILRGLYFSSGKQEGMAYSHFLKTMGLISNQDVMQEESRGIFLHDFFAKILPYDRKLFAPTQSAINRFVIARNIGLTGWAAFILFLCGLLSFSFYMNLSVLKSVSKPDRIEGSDITKINRLAQYADIVETVEEKNESWFIPRFGLNQSLLFETKLKQSFCDQFDGNLIAEVDLKTKDHIDRFTSQTNDKIIGDHVAFFVRRVNLLKAREKGGSLENLRNKPLPSFLPDVFETDSRYRGEIAHQLRKLYLNKLAWRPTDSRHIDKEINRLQSYLRAILTEKRNDLNWMAGWMNENPFADNRMKTYRLKDFWGGSGRESEKVTLGAAYTVEGRENILSFSNELKTALPDRYLLGDYFRDFESWYPSTYMTVWLDFAKSFPKGQERLRDVDEWKEALYIMPSDQGAYLSFLNEMAHHLEWLVDISPRQEWVDVAMEIRDVRAHAQQIDNPKKANLLKRMTNRVASKMGTVGRMFRAGSRHYEPSSGAYEELAEYFDQYQTQLAIITDDLTSVTGEQKVAHNMATDVYGERSPEKSDSPFFLAIRSAEKLLNNLTMRSSDMSIMKNLIYGSLMFQWEYVRREASCGIDNYWKQEVYYPYNNIRNYEPAVLSERLYGPQEGIVTQFINGRKGLSPFIQRSPGQSIPYVPKPDPIFKKTIYFQKPFLVYLKSAEKHKSDIIGTDIKRSEPSEPSIPEPEPEPQPTDFTVTITAKPADFNADAKERVDVTRLELHCGGREPQSLVNLQYPIRKTFEWSTEQCNRAQITIETQLYQLKRVFTGNYAFPILLREIRANRGSYSVELFSTDRPIPKERNIRTIHLNWELEDPQGILNAKPQRPKPPPSKPKPEPKVAPPTPPPGDIAKCWESF